MKKYLVLVLALLGTGLALTVVTTWFSVKAGTNSALYPPGGTNKVKYADAAEIYSLLKTAPDGEPLTRTVLLKNGERKVEFYQDGKIVALDEYFASLTPDGLPQLRRRTHYSNTKYTGSLQREQIWCQNGDICQNGERTEDGGWEESEYDPQTGTLLVNRRFSKSIGSPLIYEYSYRVDGSMVYSATAGEHGSLSITYFDAAGATISQTVEGVHGIEQINLFEHGLQSAAYYRVMYRVEGKIFWPGTKILKEFYAWGTIGELDHTSFDKEGTPIVRRQWSSFIKDPAKSSDRVLIPYRIEYFGKTGWEQALIWDAQGKYVRFEIIPQVPVRFGEKVAARTVREYGEDGSLLTEKHFDSNDKELLATNSSSVALAPLPMPSTMNDIPDQRVPPLEAETVPTHGEDGMSASNYVAPTYKHSPIYDQHGPP